MQIYIKYRKDGELHEDTLRIDGIELVGRNVILKKPLKVQQNGLISSLKDCDNQYTSNFDNTQIDKEKQNTSITSSQAENPDTIEINVGDIIKLKYLPEDHNNAVVMCWIVIVVIMLLVMLFSGNHHNKKGLFENLVSLVFLGMFFLLYIIHKWHVATKGVFETINQQIEIAEEEKLAEGQRQYEERRRERAVKYYKTIMREHFKTLHMKYEQTIYEDDYGELVVDGFYKEMRYFVIKVIKKQFGTNIWFDEDNTPVHHFVELFLEIEEEYLQKEYLQKKRGPVLQEISNLKKQIETGVDYENYVKTILERSGYSVKITPKTGNQGVDLIVDNDGKRTAVQCKFYSHPIGNKAVQEVSAGSKYYKCDEAVVISNQSYTPSARQLAKNLGVVLLNDGNLSSVFSDVITEKDFLDVRNKTDEESDKQGNDEGYLKQAFDEDGNLIGEGILRNGKKEGLWKIYDEDGKLSSELNFRNDKMDGVCKIYENEKLESELSYKKDKLNGLCKTYYEDGKLESFGNYKNGIKIGIWTYYSEQGKVIQKKNYSKVEDDDEYDEDEEEDEYDDEETDTLDDDDDQEDDDFDLIENDIIDL